MHLYYVLQPAVKHIIMPIYRPTIEGTQHIPAQGPVILACSHQAASETYFVPCQITREVHWLGKDALFKGKGVLGKVFAWVMRSVNVIPVDRSGAGGSARSALSAGIDVLNQGHLLGVFPEGTRSPDGRLYKGKTGAVRLALATGAPIVPVTVRGAYESNRQGAILPKRSPRMHTVVGQALDMRAELKALQSTGPEQVENSDGEADVTQLRALTRLLMSAIQDLSGQEYVDEYAADVKRALMAEAEEREAA